MKQNEDPIRQGLQNALRGVREEYTGVPQGGKKAPDDWKKWIRKLFPKAASKPFAEHHEEFWEWAWDIEKGVSPRPFIGVWPRGGGKTTNAELAAVALGALGKRKYCIYVRSTQDKADESVSNIAERLTSPEFADHYPSLSQRKLGKYGQSKGWTRNRLRTSSGYVVDGYGLDVDKRGSKVVDQRPDLIIMDDIDDKKDSEGRTRKKIETITTDLLPAGSDDVAVVGIQNLIIPHGVFSRLADQTEYKADFLQDRIVSGPVPAVKNLETQKKRHPDSGIIMHKIVGGHPTWQGKDLESCQQDLIRMGYSAFLQECQHEIHNVEGSLWDRDILRQALDPNPPRLEDFVRIVIGVDPAGGGDNVGIIVAGIDRHGVYYVIDDITMPSGDPHAWATRVCEAYEHDYGASCIAAESNYGRELVRYPLRSIEGYDDLPVKLVNVKRRKGGRAEILRNLYGENKIRHAGEQPELEKQMTSWDPNKTSTSESPNRIDALYMAIRELQRGYGSKGRARNRSSGHVSHQYSTL